MMDPEHKSILQAKSRVIAKTVSIEDIKHLLLEYKMFNKYMWQDINSSYDLFNLLPSRGPEAFQNIIQILRKTNFHHEADMLEKPVVSKLPETEDYYTMSSEPLGYCLVINNVEFDFLENREGSDIDAENIETLFKKIGFHVTTKRNKKAAEMYDCIEEFSKSDFEHVDSAIIFILSHGLHYEKEDFICGKDWQVEHKAMISKRNIINMFSNKNCIKLQNKPKIFFFIACRGEDKDYGEVTVFPHESVDSRSHTDIIPTFTDIFIVHSSLPEHVSMRDHDKGSWFCQDFLDVLKDSYNKCDFDKILGNVTRQMSKRISVQYRTMEVIHTEAYGRMKSVMLCKWPQVVHRASESRGPAEGAPVDYINSTGSSSVKEKKM